jgi:hypothetical protein
VAAAGVALSGTTATSASAAGRAERAHAAGHVGLEQPRLLQVRTSATRHDLDERHCDKRSKCNPEREGENLDPYPTDVALADHDGAWRTENCLRQPRRDEGAGTKRPTSKAPRTTSAAIVKRADLPGKNACPATERDFVSMVSSMAQALQTDETEVASCGVGVCAGAAIRPWTSSVAAHRASAHGAVISYTGRPARWTHDGPAGAQPVTELC